jgi:hypothetical protein
MGLARRYPQKPQSNAQIGLPATVRRRLSAARLSYPDTVDGPPDVSMRIH